jgi:hypothetical protein
MRHVGPGTIASLFALRCAAHPIHPADSVAAQNPNASEHADETSREGPSSSGEVPQRAELRALLCPREAKCCVQEARRAGIDRRGRSLTLVSVRPAGCAQEEGAAEEGALDLSEEGSTAYCEDHWLVAKAAGGKADTRWLGQGCRDHKTEVSTSLDLRTRTFSHGVRSLFSNEQSARSVTVDLESGVVVRLDSGIQSMSHRRNFFWDFEDFAGTLELGLDYCSPEQGTSATSAPDRDAPRSEPRAQSRASSRASAIADGRTSTVGRVRSGATETTVPRRRVSATASISPRAATP